MNYLQYVICMYVHARECVCVFDLCLDEKELYISTNDLYWLGINIRKYMEIIVFKKSNCQYRHKIEIVINVIYGSRIRCVYYIDME